MKKNGKNGKRRGNHCGTIVQKGKKWMARWYVTDENHFLKDKEGKIVLDKDGLPKHPKVRISKMLHGATTRDDAREMLETLTRRYNLDQPKGLLERLRILAADEEMRAKDREEKRQREEDAKPGLLLADAFDAFVKSPRRSNPEELTLSSYSSHFALFITWMKKRHPTVIEVRHVTPAIAEEYAVYLRDTWSASTHNKKIVFLRSCWKTLATVPGSKVKINPWEGIRNLRPDTVTRKVFTTEELIRLIPTLPSDYKLLTAIGLYTGLRIEDCAQLAWEEVDLIQGRIIIEPRKTKHIGNRRVLLPIHPILARLLASIPSVEHTGPILPELASKFKLSSRGSTVSRKFESYLAGVGIETSVKPKKKGQPKRPVKTFHSLRHTFTSRIANAGGDFSLLQKMLGHRENTMTDHYIHATLPVLREMVSALPAITEFTPGLLTNDDVIDITDSAVIVEPEQERDELTERLNALPAEEREKWQKKLLAMLPATAVA